MRPPVPTSNGRRAIYHSSNHLLVPSLIQILHQALVKICQPNGWQSVSPAIKPLGKNQPASRLPSIKPSYSTMGLSGIRTICQMS